MKRNYIFAALGAVLVFWSSIALAQEKATASEIIKNVQAAASTLAKSGEAALPDFDKKLAPWVWKDAYIFVLDCTKGVMAAHPIKPDLVGKDIMQMKDTKGTAFFGQLCQAGKTPSGMWVEYWWPKPGETAGSRKVSYAFAAAGTPFVAAAGIYDDNVAIADLEKLSAGK
jgi:signal transduction histidine kinase